MQDYIVHFEQHDPLIAGLIERYGPYTVESHTDYYHELVSSIISQQLSVKAAATIEKRFTALFSDKLPTPEQIIQADPEQLRAVGLSRPKAGYMVDLAQHILDGRLQLDKFPDMDNHAITTELVAVKGIGEWTAHMFLIFALGRLDVLPVGDLGLRNAIKLQYGFDHAPTPAECVAVALEHNWQPYQSIATWYLWKSLDNK